MECPASVPKVADMAMPALNASMSKRFDRRKRRAPANPTEKAPPAARTPGTIL
jgi:hypothetical protein